MTNVLDDRIRSKALPSPLAPEVMANFISVFGEHRLSEYYGHLLDWHGYIRFLGLPHYGENPDVSLSSMFVEPALSVGSVAPSTPLAEWPTEKSIVDALSETGRLVLLGDPGAGKSTFVDWVVQQFAYFMTMPLVARFGRRIPVPLILRELSLGPSTTWDSLLAEFLERPVAVNWMKSPEALQPFFESGQIILIADGLDELSDVPTRRAVVKSLQDFIQRYPKCLFLATSRVVGYDEVPLELTVCDPERDAVITTASAVVGTVVKNTAEKIAVPTPLSDLLGGAAGLLADWALSSSELSAGTRLPMSRHYLMPFNDGRIQRFLHHWFRKRSPGDDRQNSGPDARELRERNEPKEMPLNEQLFVALRQNPTMLELSRTPNLLTLLALIYRQRRHLPHGRAMLFKLITEAYLESIDQARGIRAVAYSLAQQTAWLSKIAFRMQQRRASTSSVDQKDGAAEAHTNILVSRRELLKWLQESMSTSHRAMGASESLEKAAETYLDVVARRSGLLLPRGTRGNESMYAFQHLSLQDYFAALYLSSILLLPRWIDGKNEKAELSPDDFRELSKQSTWRETFVLLFESLADQPGWSDELLEFLWGKDFQVLDEVPVPESESFVIRVPAPSHVKLFANVIIDPYTGLDDATRERALHYAWQWELQRAPTGLSGVLLGGEEQAYKALANEWRRYIERGGHPDFWASNGSAKGLIRLRSLAKSDRFQPERMFISGFNDLVDLDCLQDLKVHRISISQCGLTGFSEVTGSISETIRVFILVDLPALRSLEFLQKFLGLKVLILSNCPQLHSITPVQHIQALEQLFVVDDLPVSQIEDWDVLANRDDLMINDKPAPLFVAEQLEKRKVRS